ncbi:NAD(P)-dependent alcohol dehydrogenase [Microbacterium sp. HD4P20]|uniref:NAD(P)-dependent alcohol dehydrogenase n=1 Tax=Microbacterium sp. HD4P20 TaxID=2864874 RepID=UPI001C63ED19|nr:NAD(P)-dependent alcohol dehydrogenase [Microbacterium sp. HD4P20]MCP2634999.1 NAD(P)-dependent alcohol dehydrogenase [Microbacterium sp. HD4P20]
MSSTDHDHAPGKAPAVASVPGQTMRAAVVHRFGGPDVVAVERVPRPEPREGEILVRVHAASVSIADHRVRARDVPRGLRIPTMFALGMTRPRHPVLGMDAAGVVAQVGAGVTGFAPGDRVLLMHGARFGCHAEYTTISAGGAVTKIPDGVSFVDAAAVPFGFVTADAFLEAGRIGPGQHVLVNGASGAVGSAAVQLAKLRGATVTAVTSAGNAELARDLGADHVIDYAREDFSAGGIEYDAIVECVGNAPHARSVRALRPGGVLLLVIADLAGMLGSKLRPTRDGIRRIQDVAAVTGPQLARLAELAATGAIRPVIDRVYELEAIREAHEYVATGRKRGNVLITLGE